MGRCARSRKWGWQPHWRSWVNWVGPRGEGQALRGRDGLEPQQRDGLMPETGLRAREEVETRLPRSPGATSKTLSPGNRNFTVHVNISMTASPMIFLKGNHPDIYQPILG